MHSTTTTDLSIIQRNLTGNIDDRRQKVVLISTGALNPVHRAHITNLIRVKQHLEKDHGFHVVAGYLSPTHDAYVRHKLRREFIPGNHRIHMCRLAIKEANQEHWLGVDEAECSAPDFVSHRNVTQSLREFINFTFVLDKPIQVIFVAGLDLFNRCNGMTSMLKAPFDGVAIVYRSGETTILITAAQASTNSKIYYIGNDEMSDEGNVFLSEISSSKIRERDSSGGNLTYPSVLNYFQFVYASQKGK